MKEKAAAALVALGLVQMAGDVVGSPLVRGAGMATAAAPAPRVFTTIRGFEPFSTRFFLEWRDPGGGHREVELTPELYRRLRGAYNRRNAIGAVLAAGPVLLEDPLTRDMAEDVLRHALCGEARVVRELGLGDVARHSEPRLRYVARRRATPAAGPIRIAPDCGARS